MHALLRRNCVWLIPLCLAAPFYLAGLSARGPLDGHEVLVGQTAREMISTGEFIVPHFGGEPRYHKPPLAYWMTCLSYLATGTINETTARLAGVMMSLLGIALVARMGGLLFGSRVGLAAGLIHASTYWVFAYGRQTLIDATLSVLTAAAILLVLRDRASSASEASNRSFLGLRIIGFWVLCGVTVLAKGPVALGVILPTVILYRLLRARTVADQPFFWHWALAPGLILFGLISFAWPYVIWQRDPGVVDFWHAQSIGRFETHYGPNSRPWYYYCYQSIALTLPWSPLWLLSLAHALRSGKELRKDLRLLLICWFAVGIVFFSLSRGKREHYILPCLTPLSLLAASALMNSKLSIGQQTDENRFADRRLRKWAAYLAPVFSLLLLWVLDVLVQPKWNADQETLAMIRRQKQNLESADGVFQFGSNNHSWIFPMDRSMKWVSTPEELAVEVRNASTAMVLVPKSKIADLPKTIAWEQIDAPNESKLWRKVKASDVLVLMVPVEREADRYSEISDFLR